MKKLVLLLCCCLALTQIQTAAQETKLGAFVYPPFYVEQNGQIEGIAVEIITELFERLHLNWNLTMYPLKRALKYMETGKLDAIIILIKNPERAEYIDFTDPVITVRGLIWSAADRGAIEFAQLSDLSRYKLGVTLGYSYGPEFDQLVQSFPHVDPVNSDLLNFTKLLNNRIEAFPCNEIVAKSLFKQNPELQGKFTHAPNAFITWDLRIGISKKSPLVEKIETINSILTALHKEEVIEQLVKKYIE
ncbi:extracellular solute-binding protein, family 3 [Candidatus Vecturithrix granuli]|uniref:Extracellular solute-binding protein, family 3 n=1 Tax=Vecturithrix granuli TaxID=1499967 RepID=A0A081C0L5_VECG1|nr:extracellular solute-binding protein, family 3 [Candidatus Vecturithrix granuli]